METFNVIKFKYIFSEDYNPTYANGAYGGISPKGEIIINFYLERSALPISQTNEIKDDGNLGDEIEREPEDLKSSIIRFVDTGVILNYETAKEIYSWLGKHIQIIEEKVKSEKKEK